MIEIGPSPTPLIRVAPDSPPLVEIANDSERAVLGIRVVWVVTPAEGREQRSTLTMDSFMNSLRKPVIEPWARIRLGPHGMPPAPGMAGSSGGMGQEIASAIRITMKLEAVLFDDGESAGEAARELAEDITTRARESLVVAMTIRAAQARGENIARALERMAEIARREVETTRSLDALRTLNMRRQVMGSVLRLADGDAERFEGYIRHLERRPQPTPGMWKDSAG